MFFDTGNLRSSEICLEIEKTTPENLDKKWVPAYYFLIRRAADGTELGRCDFRVGNTEKTFFGGNIGYEIFEKHRGNHYAAKACLLLFKLAKRHKMSYLHITCNPENYASRKTCEVAGGKLLGIINLPTDNDMYLDGDRQKCVYYFDLNE